jgi:hypothetical protein
MLLLVGDASLKRRCDFSSVFKCFQEFSSVFKSFQAFSRVFKRFQEFSRVFKRFSFQEFSSVRKKRQEFVSSSRATDTDARKPIDQKQQRTLTAMTLCIFCMSYLCLKLFYRTFLGQKGRVAISPVRTHISTRRSVIIAFISRMVSEEMFLNP